MKKETKGFTLIELVVVMVIIGILFIIGVPLYRGYIRRAMVSEGVSLCGIIASQEKTYYIEFGSYHRVSPFVGFDDTLGIDARLNTYFQTFRVFVAGADQVFRIRTDGVDKAAGIRVEYDSDPDNNNLTDTAPEISVSE